jgi:hypothetical protein
MARPVDLACFSTQYLALLRRFPNQLDHHPCLVTPAPEAPGVLVFAASHNHHYLLFHDPDGFSNGVYEFGLPEEFYSAIGPRHMSQLGPGGDAGLRLALSNGEYRLYQDADNESMFTPGADDAVVFTWSADIGRARQQLRDAMDAILYLHQEGNGLDVEQALSHNYVAEVDFIRRQLSSGNPVVSAHRWIRLPDNSVRCLTQFGRAGSPRQQVQALICVDAEMVLG